MAADLRCIQAMLNRADWLLLLCGITTRFVVGEAGVQVFAVLLWVRLLALPMRFTLIAS